MSLLTEEDSDFEFEFDGSLLSIEGNGNRDPPSPAGKPNGEKWAGSVEASIAVPMEKAWEVLSDFCGIHKFVPMVEMCEMIRGKNRVPGCVRFYTMLSPNRLPGGKRKIWVRDKLVEIDPPNRSFSYNIQGTNLPLSTDCIVRFKVREGLNGGTVVGSSFEMSPFSETTHEKALGDLTEITSAFIHGIETCT